MAKVKDNPLWIHGAYGKNHIWFSVPDYTAGLKNRYTTYEIKLKGNKAAKIIGRELSLPHSKKLVTNCLKGGK